MIDIIISGIKYILARILTLFCKQKTNVWLFGERPDEARDNGYWMFKFVTENHSEILSYYAISSSCADYVKVSSLGKTVEYGSFKHYMLYFSTSVYLSTHKYGYAPNPRLCRRADIYFNKNKKRIFLQHGIIMNFHPQDMYEDNDISLYVVSAEREMKFLMEKNHFPESHMCLSGLARYDNLYSFSTKNQILFMPTWRGYLFEANEEEIKQSDYFKKIQELLSSEKLHKFLEETDTTFVFYPHYMMQKYLKNFGNLHCKVVLAEKEKYDVQVLLKESKILITDYSSVHFDFAYMKKPICYFQHDVEEFYGQHYQKGYYDFYKDGFGDVIADTDKLVDRIIEIHKNGAIMFPVYVKRVDDFYKFHDQENCVRIFNQVLSLGR